jgi:hypothetical protein
MSGMSSEDGHEWWVDKDYLEGGDPDLFRGNAHELAWDI